MRSRGSEATRMKMFGVCRKEILSISWYDNTSGVLDFQVFVCLEWASTCQHGALIVIFGATSLLITFPSEMRSRWSEATQMKMFGVCRKEILSISWYDNTYGVLGFQIFVWSGLQHSNFWSYQPPHCFSFWNEVKGVRSYTDEDVWRLQERNSLYLMIWWTLMGFGLSNFCLFDLGFNIGVTSLLIAFPFLKCGQGGQTMFGVCRKESLSHSYLMGLHLKNFRLSGLCLFYLGFWSDIGAGSSRNIKIERGLSYHTFFNVSKHKKETTSVKCNLSRAAIWLHAIIACTYLH